MVPVGCGGIVQLSINEPSSVYRPSTGSSRTQWYTTALRGTRCVSRLGRRGGLLGLGLEVARRGAYVRPHGGRLDIVTLTKARSLLVILIATCRETLLALDATANILDEEMTQLLRTMIDRSEAELKVLTDQLQTATG
jgi:hypothetical protein